MRRGGAGSSICCFSRTARPREPTRDSLFVHATPLSGCDTHRIPAPVTHPFQLAAQPVSIASQLRALGERLKMARKARGWSVSRQAGRAGLSREVVERIEKGASSASFGEVLALCSSLGLRLIPEDQGVMTAASLPSPATLASVSIPAHLRTRPATRLGNLSAPEQAAEA